MGLSIQKYIDRLSSSLTACGFVLRRDSDRRILIYGPCIFYQFCFSTIFEFGEKVICIGAIMTKNMAHILLNSGRLWLLRNILRLHQIGL